MHAPLTRLGLSPLKLALLLVLLLLFAVASLSCSAHRDERLPSSCVTDTQCGSEELCLAGRCTASDGALVTGKVAGAPEGVLIQSGPVSDELCSYKEDQGLVCSLSPGGRVVLIAPDVEGYRFTGWTGQGCSGSELTLELDDVVRVLTCVANYAQRLRVSGSVEGNPALSVRASSESTSARCERDGCQVDAGERVVLQAPERDGYRITGFAGDGCEERSGYRVTVTPTDHDVVCVAQYVESLTVRGQLQGLADGVEASIAASSSSSGALCEGQLCAVDPGADVTLRAPEVTGYRFRGWSGDTACLGSEPELLVTQVNSNVVCTADYVPRFAVQAIAEGLPQDLEVGFVGSSGDLFSRCDGARCEVDQGESASFLAGSVAGFRLAFWSGDGCESLSGTSVVVRDVRADVTCTAHFVEGVSVSGTLVNVEGEVSASSSSRGAECARGSCAIDPGGAVTLVAPSIPGRTFLGWTGDPGCMGSTLEITLADVTRSKSCRATFAARFSVISRALPEAGGTVRASSGTANASCLGARCEVDEGSAVTLEASTNPSFRFTGWSGGGPCAGSAPQLTLNPVQSSITCSANYVARVVISGGVAPAFAGSVSASQLSLSAVCAGASCTVDAGSSVTLTAPASTGYQFTSWSGCGGLFNPLLGSNPLPVVGPTTNEQCTANFEKLRYPVSALPSTGGSVSASSGGAPCPGAICSVAFGESATLSASPELGYTFAGWSGCTGGSDLVVGNVSGPVSCTATFERIRVALTGVSNPGSVTGISASSSSPGAACGGASCSVDYGSSVSLSAPATATGYRFGGWSGCPDSQVAGTSLTIPSLTSTRSCSADYIRVWTVTGGVYGSGSVDCAGGCPVDQGGSITLAARPGPNYSFGGWSCSPSNNSTLVLANVSANLTCIATFNPILL